MLLPLPLLLRCAALLGGQALGCFSLPLGDACITLPADTLAHPSHPAPLWPGEDIPEWFAFKSVVQVLRDAIAEESSASESESS